MGPLVTSVLLFVFISGNPSETRRTEDGMSSMWHVFRQIHESDVARRPYLAARRSSSPLVIERTRIIPASEPKPLAPSTIITRIKSANRGEDEPITKAPKSALSSVWSLKMSGRMSEADSLLFNQAERERADASGQLTSPTLTANSDLQETKASGKPEVVQAEHLRQQSVETTERNQSQVQGERQGDRHQSSHAEEPFNEGGSGRRNQQAPSLKFWQVFRKRIPERWSVFNKAAPATNETVVQPPSKDIHTLEADDKAPTDQIKALEDAVVATTTQLPEPAVQRSDEHPEQQLAISVNGPSKRRLTIQVDNATFYAADSFMNGSLILQRTDAASDTKGAQSLDDIEIYYPGIGSMIQNRPLRIVINWSGVVMSEPQSEVAPSETTEAAELTAPPTVVESTTDASVVSVSEDLVTPADFITEEYSEALTTTMPTSTTDDQLTTPLLKSSEDSALTDPLVSTTTTLAEPAASARSFISVSSSSSSSSVSSTNGVSYISRVSSSYTSSNGSLSLNTRTATSTVSKGNITAGLATGSIDLIAPDNRTSVFVSSDSLNNTGVVRSRVIRPARFWSIASAKNPPELPKPRTAEISEILPFLKNQSLSLNRTSTMAPLLIFMKGSSPIVFAASAESLDQFTTVKTRVDKPTLNTSPVAHKNQSLPLKLRSPTFLHHPKANFSNSDASMKAVSHNSSLTSSILAHAASLVSGKSSPAVSNRSSSDTKLKPSARHMEADDVAARTVPKVHVIMATALADPPEFEFRDRALDSPEDNDGRKYDAYWAVPAHGQLVETPNGYLAGSSPGVSSHMTNQSHVNNVLPSLPRFTCGQDTSTEEFVLTNPSFPDPDEDAGRCDFRIHVTSPSVCQVRIEFKDSRMLLPRHGSCLYQQMSVSGSLTVSPGPKFCGWNADQHFYLELSGEGTSPRHVDINVHTKAAGYRYSYAIVVKQIDCHPPNQLMAPKGCFQYYHSSQAGEIKSFNFDGGQYWSEQNYKICIRTSPTTCTISMTSANGNFGLNELTNRTPRSTGRLTNGSCARDYLVIPSIYRVGSTEVDGGDKSDFADERVCGTKFADPRDERARSGILVGPLKYDIYVMEFHAGAFRRYETRHFGPGFAINYKEVEDCPEKINRRSR